MILKKIQLIMLPTNEKAENCLIQYYNKELRVVNGLLTSSYLKEVHAKAFHLYFLSDEEIKEEDWAYDPFANKVGVYGVSWYKDNKKIIATTDRLVYWKAFYREDEGVLPQPSQSFLEVYVKEYNRGNQIKQVMVECEESGGEPMSGPFGTFMFKSKRIVKVNPKDNTITIKTIKDSWDREEVSQLVHKYRKEMCIKGDCNDKDCDKWIEQNL